MIEKEKLKKLYERGMSMSEIAEKFGWSVCEVTYWMRKHKITRRSWSQAGYCAYQRRFNKRPFKLRDNLTAEQEKLRIAGIMLYWAEGTKGGNHVDFTNSDPKAIQIFLKFLREICGIQEERLRLLLYLFTDHNENELKKYWSKITGISLNQFSASHIRRGRKGTYKRKSKYGTAKLRYSDKRLFEQIMKWIEGYLNKNLNG